MTRKWPPWQVAWRLWECRCQRPVMSTIGNIPPNGMVIWQEHATLGPWRTLS